MSANASKPFHVVQHLARAGRWRVQIKFKGSGGFKPSSAPSHSFLARGCPPADRSPEPGHLRLHARLPADALSSSVHRARRPALLRCRRGRRGQRAGVPVVGVNIAYVPTDAQISTANSLGAKNVRMFLLWKDVEPVNGRFDEGLITRYGEIVRQLRALGIATDFVVVRAPRWETGSQD